MNFLLRDKHVHKNWCTVCPGSIEPFYIVSYYIKWVTTSWTYSSRTYPCVDKNQHPKHTICSRSLDLIYIVSYYINWVTTSWTYSLWVLWYFFSFIIHTTLSLHNFTSNKPWTKKVYWWFCLTYRGFFLYSLTLILLGEGGQIHHTTQNLVKSARVCTL